MTANQQIASNPAISAWVSASAGTGKTKVLSDRVLRLLLSGTAPSRILCITYTKAAAAEMTSRIQDQLRAWAVMDAYELTGVLAALTGEAPGMRLLTRARKLFAEVLETPGGMRIQTIHSLCQSLLQRFPLEAGTQPHFSVIDERTALDLLKEARLRLFSQSREREDPRLAEAIDVLAGRISEYGFIELLNELICDRRKLTALLKRPSGIIRLNTELWERLGFSYRAGAGDLFARHFSYEDGEEDCLRDFARRMYEEGSNSDRALGEAMLHWLELSPELRENHLASYHLAWLTLENKPRKLPTAKMAAKLGSLVENAKRECARVSAHKQAVLAWEVARMTEYVFDVAEGLLALYDHQKATRAFLDYDDLILITRDLLHRPGIAPWVLYKLDGGLDHVLIDEAQDTSPEQWQIVRALVEEFFSGQGAREVTRTLFVVGDEKQSIFSFQGAQPAEFMRMQSYFAQRITEAGEAYKHVTLAHSFRSTQAVLSAVDAVFALPVARQGAMAGDQVIHHAVTRRGAPGKVELWPLIEPAEESRFSPWQIAEAGDNPYPAVQLAHRIAATIRQWLDEEQELPARGRPIRPGDIMILVRKRGMFMGQMVRALKERNIPVAGVDRLVLTEHIAVMDLMALGQFLLLPEDDLTLACLLKSPLFGFSEEQLFAIAHGREKQSLWARLFEMQRKDAVYAKAVERLTGLLAKVDYVAPYELFAHVLYAQDGLMRWVERLGEECRDPIYEFLALALQFESKYPPSLQGFLNWLVDGDLEIKRDPELRRDEVQVMTVHGAKGLQAPIVFLPDTTDVPKLNGRLYWHQEANDAIALLAPAGEACPDLIERLKEARRQAMTDESMRLLYVAMTRAEDQLFIAGWKGKKSLPELCWYQLVEQALAPLTVEAEAVLADGTVVTVRRLEDARQEAAKRSVAEEAPVAIPPLPGWIGRMPPDEPDLPSPLTPSRLEQEPAVLSPVSDTIRFRRGRLIHRLLQYLPDVPAAQRTDIATHFLARQAKDIAVDGRDQMISEVMAVLAHPEFAPVFGPGSAAEIPVSGVVELDGKPYTLSGQIDRLFVTEREVWIVDYKTQRQPPSAVADIPAVYLKQMASYRLAMQRIYPGRTVHCALLYTAGPILLPLQGHHLAGLDAAAA